MNIFLSRFYNGEEAKNLIVEMEEIIEHARHIIANNIDTEDKFKFMQMIDLASFRDKK